MTLELFTRLSLGDKADYLWRKGAFIEKYCDKNYTVNLYYLPHFFVEVVVAHHTYRIREIKGFEKGQKLDKYLEEIDLKELFTSA